jgi:hypothetical protein
MRVPSSASSLRRAEKRHRGQQCATIIGDSECRPTWRFSASSWPAPIPQAPLAQPSPTSGTWGRNDHPMPQCVGESKRHTATCSTTGKDDSACHSMSGGKRTDAEPEPRVAATSQATDRGHTNGVHALQPRSFLSRMFCRSQAHAIHKSNQISSLGPNGISQGRVP